MTAKDPLRYTIDDTETVTEAVAKAVATVNNENVQDIPPLYREGLHPEGLNMLFSTSAKGRVEFNYYGTKVIVQHGEEVTVTLTEQQTA